MIIKPDEVMTPDSSQPAPTRHSLLWSGLSVGDAIEPIRDWSHGMYLQVMSGKGRLFQYGVLGSNHASYSGNLEPTNPAGTTLRIASGAAWVLYHLYTSDANIDFDLSNPGYYRIVLRRRPTAQTVRAAVKGPNTQRYPDISLSDPFEFALARAHSNGSTLDILRDDRRFFRNLIMPFRRGNAAGNQWGYTYGTAKRFCGASMIQCGAVESAAGQAIFPIFYGGATGNDPVVFFQTKMLSGSVPVTSKLVSTNLNNSYATFSVTSDTNINSVMWLAIGPTYRGVA